MPNNPHTIATTVDQSGPTGTRYLFRQWSDGGAPAHTIVATQSTTTYTATFDTQYQLTTTVSPSLGGSVTAGGWHNVGANVSVTATPASGYEFAGFSGDLSGPTNPQTVTMNTPRTVTANFVLSNRAPAAVPDAYAVDEDERLQSRRPVCTPTTRIRTAIR